MSLKITSIRFWPHLSGANEFSNQWGTFSMHALGHVLHYLRQWRKTYAINIIGYVAVPYSVTCRLDSSTNSHTTLTLNLFCNRQLFMLRWPRTCFVKHSAVFNMFSLFFIIIYLMGRDDRSEPLLFNSTKIVFPICTTDCFIISRPIIKSIEMRQYTHHRLCLMNNSTDGSFRCARYN